MSNIKQFKSCCSYKICQQNGNLSKGDFPTSIIILPSNTRLAYLKVKTTHGQLILFLLLVGLALINSPRSKHAPRLNEGLRQVLTNPLSKEPHSGSEELNPNTSRDLATCVKPLWPWQTDMTFISLLPMKALPN